MVTEYKVKLENFYPTTFRYKKTIGKKHIYWAKVLKENIARSLYAELFVQDNKVLFVQTIWNSKPTIQTIQTIEWINYS